MYYVYIIQSQLDNSFYIGFSTNVEARLKEHNFGKTNYTSKKRPWRLVYTEEFKNKTDALKRELFLKRQKNKEFYQSLIKKMDR
jgi:putative endonuclease